MNSAVIRHYKSLSDMSREIGYPPPEMPLFRPVRCEDNCSLGEREFTSDFYIIGFKKLKSGVVLYGRTEYDHENGSMMFVKPRQVLQFKNLQFEEDGFLIFIHEDFLNGHFLHNEIKKYGYFEYEANEALHLSPKEEEVMWDLFHRIEAEYNNNTDEFSRDIMLTHIDSILKYAQRYY